MLGKFSDYKDVYVEITKSEHKHGGEGWEFGTCLWSPSKNKAGADRYAIMREPRANALVLHFYRDKWPDGISDTRLCGRSCVFKKCRSVKQEPPSAGYWANMAPYYRIDLRDYNAFEKPLSLSTLLGKYEDEIRRDLEENRPRFYPFTIHGWTLRTVQGIYLARCTPKLYQLFKLSLGLEAGAQEVPKTEMDPHTEFAEARRMCSERYFFSRNPKLVKQAKEFYGYTCQVCGFNFEDKYGELGKGYIECHHLDPLSERSEEGWSNDIKSTLKDVNVVCANCHRMIHRKRPGISLAEIKEAIVKLRH